MIRKPSVAGQFYPGERDKLLSFMKGFKRSVLPVESRVVVSPHAGYMYSGQVAGEVFAGIEVPDSVLVLSPNHTGMGVKVSINSSGAWETPLGNISIDSDFASLLKSKSAMLQDDELAHRREHSLEVQLPFIQYFNPKASFVPVTLKFLNIEQCRGLGEAVARAILETEKNVLIVASTDMTHFEPHDEASKKDRMAIDAILKIDPEALYETVISNNISMCGIIPTTIALYAARKLGASQGKLVRYSTSGDVSGEKDSVVGYAGIIIS